MRNYRSFAHVLRLVDLHCVALADIDHVLLVVRHNSASLHLLVLKEVGNFVFLFALVVVGLGAQGCVETLRVLLIILSRQLEFVYVLFDHFSGRLVEAIVIVDAGALEVCTAIPVFSVFILAICHREALSSSEV